MDELFSSRELNESGVARVDETRAAFQALLQQIERGLSASRQLSLCKTHLEAACLYAVKAVANEDEFQKKG